MVWRNVYFITGTDIVRCLSFRFEAFGREITNRKKFEEGIFSDLRNLKCDNDAVLEQPKSEFLDFLYRNNCVRTQKKQKIFYWFSVNHDRLFQDALERDLKKELATKRASTTAVRDPALSFQYDSSRTLHDQLPDIIEKFPRPLAELADASSVMSNVTLPSGHLIQIPPHFYPNPMHPGFPAPGPPEMQVPMLMNQPQMLPPNVMNPYTAGQEVGFPPGAESMVQPIHHHHHPMIGMPVQAASMQGMPIQELPGVYPQQFQMPMSLPAQGGIPMGAIPSYQPMDMYQQQIQAQAVAQAQAAAIAAAQAQIQIQPQPQLQPQFQHQLPKVTEVEEPAQQEQLQPTPQIKRAAGSEEINSDFPLDYVSQADGDQTSDATNADGATTLPDRQLGRNVSSEPFEILNAEKEPASATTVSHDHTKLEVMYRQNEDGTFVSVLVPNGTANSMVDYANGVNAPKPSSSSFESQPLQARLPEDAASTVATTTATTTTATVVTDATSSTNIKEEAQPSTTTSNNEENSPKQSRDSSSAQSSHSALLPKALKSKISKPNLQGAQKVYRSTQQRAVNGAIAAQINASTGTYSSGSSSSGHSVSTQELSGPPFFMPTPSESGCSDVTGYQPELEATTTEVAASPTLNQTLASSSVKPRQQQQQQQQPVLTGNQGQQVQYFTAANGARIPTQVISTADGSFQFVPTTVTNATTQPATLEASVPVYASLSNTAPGMVPVGSMPGITMDDFMYLNPDMDTSAEFGMGFGWNGGV